MQRLAIICCSMCFHILCAAPSYRRNADTRAIESNTTRPIPTAPIELPEIEKTNSPSSRTDIFISNHPGIPIEEDKYTRNPYFDTYYPAAAIYKFQQITDVQEGSHPERYPCATSDTSQNLPALQECPPQRPVSCEVTACACPGYFGWTGQLYRKQQSRVSRKLDPQDCICRHCLGFYYIWDK